MMEENENIEMALFSDIPAEMPGVSRVDGAPGGVINDNNVHDDSEEATGVGQNYDVMEDKHQNTGSKTGDFVSDKIVDGNSDLSGAVEVIETELKESEREETIMINDPDNEDDEIGDSTESNLR